MLRYFPLSSLLSQSLLDGRLKLYCFSTKLYQIIGLAGIAIIPPLPASCRFLWVSQIFFVCTLTNCILSCIQYCCVICSSCWYLCARAEYQLSSAKYINVIMRELRQHYLYIDNTQSFLDRPSKPKSVVIKCKFMTNRPTKLDS